MPLNRHDVVQAYRYILGREPENDEVVARHLRDHPDLDSLRQAFLNSEELRLQLGRTEAKVVLADSLPLDAPALPIETDTDPATLAKVVAHTARFWEAIGETAPHWSVITSDEFRPERVAANEVQFFRSAEVDRDLLLALLRRIDRAPGTFRKLVEFGCGVGRLTTHLAGSFENVIGLDISRPHLRLAEDHMRRFGRCNVSFRLVTPDNLHPVDGFDLWFSRIVLQHNPPPVIMHILDRMFDLLAPGGVSIFQVPTYYVGYRFSIAEYLQSDLGSSLEMHAVPQRAVLDLAHRHRCRLLEIREDTPVIARNPDYLSNTLIFQKE